MLVDVADKVNELEDGAIKMKTDNVKKLLCCVAALLLILSSCFMLPIEDPVPPPPVTQAAEAPTFSTITITRGDVVRDEIVVASQIQGRNEPQTFNICGLYLRGIYVNMGDYVQEGDIIASLYSPELQERLQSALRQEEWLRLNLSQLGERQAISRRIAAVSGFPMDNTPYNQERTRLEWELDLLFSELEFLQRENDLLYLHASTDGIISRVLTYEPGLVLTEWTHVAVITDQAQPIFRVTSAEAAPAMGIGDYFILTIEDKLLLSVVIDPDEWEVPGGAFYDREIFLIFAEEMPDISPNSRGNIYVLIDKAENVIFLPHHAVHYAGGRAFVFVLSDSGLRVLRDIEIGLKGNTTYEIVSGLEEGELVVIN